MKEAYYFSHDANAQDDEKIMNMMAEFDWAGYGVYWGIIEALRSATEYRFKVNSLKGMAHKMRISVEMLKSIIYDFDLFQTNDEYFWSESLNRRMELRDLKIEQARTAGQRSGEVRRTKMNDRSTDVQQTFNDSSTEGEQLKERKGKEINTTTTTTTTTAADEFEITQYFEMNAPAGSDPYIEAKNFINLNNLKKWEAAGGVENWRKVVDMYIKKIKVEPIKSNHNGNGNNNVSAGKFEPVAKLIAEARQLNGT